VNNPYIDVAKHYHETTKLFYLQLESKPSASKLYPAQPQIVLPTDFPSPALSTLEAVAGAASPEARTTVDKATLAALCFYAAGRIRKRDFRGAGEVYFRAASSAGGLYPIETYVVCGDLSGLAAGVYHFSSADFALRLLRQGDYRAVLAQAVGGAATVLSAPATLVFASVFWRSAWKYRVRSYRYCFWDNGTILANLLATATALGQPANVLMGFVDAQVNHLLGLDGQREACTCLVTVGQTAPVPTSAAPAQVAPLSAETAPDSRGEIDYPEITELHAASGLTSAEQVIAWKGVELTPPRPLTGTVYPLEATLPTATSLAQTIRLRGSTRRFAREAIAFAQLSAILAQATTGMPADFLRRPGTSLLDVYLIVNAVDGLPAGSYVFSPAERALMALRSGEFREEAGHLCFEQALGADASAVVFFMADLQEVLTSFGNRGYRAVQLEAGVVGGNMYLGAYAMGLGASGLTFYDDEVTTYFSPHAAGKSAIFVVALGKTAHENRVRPFRSRVGMVIDAMSRRDTSA
jgi:SagB-type dehydrogenase family enzyme